MKGLRSLEMLELSKCKVGVGVNFRFHLCV